MATSRHRVAWEWAFVAITAFWGWSFSAIHFALQSLSDAAFNTWRFAIAALCLLPVWLWRRTPLSRHDVVGGGLAGLALFAAFLFQTKGLRYTSASNASFITGLAVIITPMLAWRWLGIALGRQQLAGALLAAVGLAMLTLSDMQLQLGDALVLGCAICFAVHVIVLSRASKLADTLNITLLQLLVVAGLSAIQAALDHSLLWPKMPVLLQSVLPIALLGTALGFFVQTRVQVLSSPNKIALIIVMEPVFGGVFGYLLAGDRLTLFNWCGALLIVLAMLLTEWQFGRRKVVVG